MLEPLDIFIKMEDGTYMWKAAADSFEAAKSKVSSLVLTNRRPTRRTVERLSHGYDELGYGFNPQCCTEPFMCHDRYVVPNVAPKLNGRHCIFPAPVLRTSFRPQTGHAARQDWPVCRWRRTTQKPNLH